MAINIMQASKSQPVTVRGGLWDDDVFDQDWCNHAGAEIEEIPELRWNSDCHEFTDDDSTSLAVCDKCNAMLVGDEWVAA